MANIILFTLGRELDANGITVPGAKAYFYEAGTTTPLPVYTDDTATTLHPSPLVADAGGLFAAVYTTGSSAKAVITKADDTALRTIDPCPLIAASGVGASSITFSPTVDIPATNVQDAIEAAAATAAVVEVRQDRVTTKTVRRRAVRGTGRQRRGGRGGRGAGPRGGSCHGPGAGPADGGRHDQC